MLCKFIPDRITYLAPNCSSRQVLKDADSRHKDEIPLICFDLVYIFELLTEGYKRDHAEVLHAGKSIQLNGNPIETQWPLGAGLLLV